MTQQTQQSSTIQETIAQEFGFNDLDAERQQELIERMTESVIKRVLVDAYAKLSDSDRKRFEELMENIENVDPQAIEAFLREKLTDYDAIVTNAIAELKKTHCRYGKCIKCGNFSLEKNVLQHD